MDEGDHVPLLRADEIELTRAAEALKAGASLVVIACTPRADRAARKAFAACMGEGWEVVDVVLYDADNLPAKLRESAAPRPREVVRLVLGRGDDVLEGLNLHREKLRQEGARLALWVAGHDAYRELVRRAPDAFSFRDAVAIVVGDEPEPPASFREESDALKAARARSARVGEGDADARATAWADLVEELFGAGTDEARREADSLIAFVRSSAQPWSDALRRALARALAYRTPNIDGRLLRQRVDGEEALALLDGLASPIDRAIRVLVETNQPGPPGYGRDWPTVVRALAEAGSPLEKARASRSMFTTLLARDDVRHAVPPTHVASSSEWSRAMALRDRASYLVASGAWSEARRALHATASLTMPKTLGIRQIARAREAITTLRIGELDACRRITRGRDSGEATTSPALKASLERTDALAVASAGDFEGGLAAMHGALLSALGHEVPVEALETLDALATLVRAGVAIGALNEPARRSWDEKLVDAARRGVLVAGFDPPWFPILFDAVLAGHLGRQKDRRDEAVALSAAALTRAESDADVLAPEVGRVLAEILVDQGEHARVRALATRLVPTAREHHVMREVVRLAAVDAIARTRAGASNVDDAVQTVRAAIEESGALPVGVVAARQLGAELLAAGHSVAGRELLEWALGQAQEMPWPIEQGRALAALNRPDEASHVLSRWGLRLEERILRRGPTVLSVRGCA